MGAQTVTSNLTPAGFVLLRPDQIKIDDLTNVRLGPQDEDEDKRIEELAHSLRTEGQLQPIVVRTDGENGDYSLIAGRRRLAAAKRADMLLSAIILDKSDDEAYRAALMENLKRRAMSPIDLAHNIALIRLKHEWEGPKGTKKVAQFLGVSPATVTTHEQLLTVSPEIQAKAHKGHWSAEAALEFATNVASELHAEVATRAEELALEEQKAKTSQKRGRTKQGVSQVQATSADVASDAVAPKGTKSRDVKVSRKHIEKAAKEKGAQKEIKAPSKSAILQFFESVGGGSDYPSTMIAFADAISGPYAEGKLSDKQLLNRWDAIASLIPAKHRGVVTVAIPAKKASKKKPAQTSKK